MTSSEIGIWHQDMKKMNTMNEVDLHHHLTVRIWALKLPMPDWSPSVTTLSARNEQLLNYLQKHEPKT